MKIWKKHKLLILNILFLGVAAFILLRLPGTEIGQDMTETLMEEGVPLRAGIYEARLYYDVPTDMNCQFGVETEYGLPFRSLRINPVTLFADSNEAVCPFYLTGSCRSLRAYVTGEENGITIRGVEIRSENAGGRVALFWLTVISITAQALIRVYSYNKKHPFDKNTQLVTGGLCLVILCASLPLAVDYIIGTERLAEDLTAIERLSRSGKEFFALKDSLDEFRANLFLFFPALLRRIGLPMNMAYRMYVFAVNAATALAGYLCFGKCLKEKGAGMVGCIFYTLNPYRIGRVYERTSVWEYTAMIFVPLLLFGIYGFFRKNSGKKERVRALCVFLGGCVGVLISNPFLRGLGELLPAAGIATGIVAVCGVAGLFKGYEGERYARAALGCLAAGCVLFAVYRTNLILFQGEPRWVYGMEDMENAAIRGLNYLSELSYK